MAVTMGVSLRDVSQGEMKAVLLAASDTICSTPYSKQMSQMPD